MGAAAPLADLNPNPLALDDDECALSERSASTIATLSLLTTAENSEKLKAVLSRAPE